MDGAQVVVGAGSGIGEAVARELAKRAPVLVADRDRAAAQRVANSLGTDSMAVECDVTVMADVAALAEQVERLGALVITAGLSPQMATDGQIWSVNLLGTARILDALFPMVGPGSVAVCLASCVSYLSTAPESVLSVIDDPLGSDFAGRLAAAGVDPDQAGSAYSLSKIGVRRLVSRLAKPWGDRGGRIVSLSAGVIDTPMGRLAVADETARLTETMATWPIPRLGTPEEIASAAAFLCSPAASYMSGCDVLVDGGFVTSWQRSEGPNAGQG